MDFEFNPLQSQDAQPGSAKQNVSHRRIEHDDAKRGLSILRLASLPQLALPECQHKDHDDP
jgi:hypothetical protein